jgi:hypothetical protein
MDTINGRMTFKTYQALRSLTDHDLFTRIEEEKRLTDLLEKAYLESRYENNYAVNENDLTVFFDKVKLLQDTCKELVEIKTDLEV